MEIKASLKYFRAAPRKTRLVADLIREMDVNRARIKLQFLRKRAAKPFLKLLNSAVANASKNLNFDEKKISSLYIKKITVDEGPKLKRWMPVSRGTSHPIQKKTSHITLVLDEKPKQEKSEARNSKSKTSSNNQNPKSKIEKSKSKINADDQKSKFKAKLKK